MLELMQQKVKRSHIQQTSSFASKTVPLIRAYLPTTGKCYLFPFLNLETCARLLARCKFDYYLLFFDLVVSNQLSGRNESNR